MSNPPKNNNSSMKKQPKGCPNQLLPLEITKAVAPPPPPIFFQCPISLELMQSPVILCTGITYDRSSIQKWLDSGNTTCPATMLPLPSTDLLPNLTLRRLIHNWLHNIPSNQISSLIPAATVLEFIENPEIMTDLMKLIGESDDAEAVDAGLRFLIGLTTGVDLSITRKVRQEIVKRGVVSAVTKVLMRDGNEMPAAVAEKAIRVMKAAAGCVEGRGEICKEAGRCVEAVVRRMVSVGSEGREAAVGVLWKVCCGGGGGGDRRAREALGMAKGGMGKILVVMQGECSPAVRMMAGDLLRVFPADVKCSVAAAGCQSRTVHITPF